ncbi:MAG TPA: DUF3137 domain-containing protein [Chitinophagales bacterium]|nr:DUF3137 domain-containing protein [Chitinophagales bacterium]
MALTDETLLKLETALSPLDSKKWQHTMSRVLRMILEFFFVALIVSMFIGFLSMMSNGEMGDDMFFRVIRGFMLFVLAMVLFGIIRKTARDRFLSMQSAIAHQPWTLNLITIVFTVCAFAIGYFAGTAFLGGTFSPTFMIKWAGAIGSIFFLLGPYLLLKRIEDNFTQQYKSILFANFLPGIAPQARYVMSEHIGTQTFTESKLFPYQEISSLKGSDLITRSQEQFQCSFLDVMQVERTQSNGKSETKYSTLFKGYLLSAAFNKSFTGETFVAPDASRELLGEVYGESLNELFHRPGTSIARMEDPDFEKAFSVYTTDQQEARYILSTKLIHRIMELKAYFVDDVYLSFVGNRVFVAVKSEKDIFSPPTIGNTYNKTLAEKQYAMLNALVTVPELFDLDRRIWAS